MLPMYVGGTGSVLRHSTNRNQSMVPSDAKLIRVLEGEDGKLKKLLAEKVYPGLWYEMPYRARCNTMLRDINSNKWRRPLGSGKRWRI